MQLKSSFILVALLCMVHTNDAATNTSSKLPAHLSGPRVTDVLVFVNNSTSTTFNVRMSNGSGWVFYSVGPGGTNIGPMPEGTYTVAIDPNNGGSPQYNFSGFCSYTGSGYTVYWTNVVIQEASSCNQINISYR